MKLLPIYEDEKFLSAISEPFVLSELDRTFVKNLYDDMSYTMFSSGGIGLAGIQVGYAKQIFIIDGQLINEKDPIVFINPEIFETSEELVECREGCLSIPDKTFKVMRPRSLKIKAYDLNFNQFELDTKGDKLLSSVISHETDHLFGRILTNKKDSKMI